MIAPTLRGIKAKSMFHFSRHLSTPGRQAGGTHAG
jgi:hypothetical protein